MPDTPQTDGQRNRIVLICAAVVASGLVLILFLFATLWFGASGGGEYRDSPDCRYTAHLMLMEKGTWFHGRITFVELRVEEKATGNTVWTAEYHPPAGSSPHIYGDRSKRFINWNDTSTQVTFPLDTSGMEIDVPVP